MTTPRLTTPLHHREETQVSYRGSGLEEVEGRGGGGAHGEEEKEGSLMKRLAKDQYNVAVLLLLYVLQGVPIGLSASVPMVLQAKMIGYRQQAMFSLVTWPFSIKLLWAPVVDAIYSRSFGRRKSWLVPIQYALGLAMIFLSYTVDGLMGEGSAAPNVFLLTVFFFILHFLAATQDIAVDGWALTMLSRVNVGYASTCNSVGQTAGFFLGYTIFLALESKEFCNTYLRLEPQESGILDLSTFLYCWGFVFITVTTAIWWFKRESREEHAEGKRTIMGGEDEITAPFFPPPPPSLSLSLSLTLPLFLPPSFPLSSSNGMLSLPRTCNAQHTISC